MAATVNLINNIPNTTTTSVVEYGRATITITADSGYTIVSARAEWEDDYDSNSQNASISEDGSTATLTSLYVGYSGTVDITLIGETTSSGGGGGGGDTQVTLGGVNIYALTNDELNTFATQRWFTTNLSDYAVEIVDLGQYVSCLYKPMFAVDPDSSVTTIVCGDHTANVTALLITNTTHTINCGTADVPTLNHSSNDYAAEITAFLPFIGNVALPVWTMGKTLALSYAVDLTSGVAVCNLSCDDVLVYGGQCRPFLSVPYLMANDRVINAREHDSLWLLGLTPYVRVINHSEILGAVNADNNAVALSEITGYAAVADVQDLTGIATQSEYNEILQLLSSGVYFE